MQPSPKQPMAEVFGFPIGNMLPDAARHRNLKLCPFNNRVPNCTKDKAKDPLGVCSVFEGANVVVTCPIRFRENWLIAEDAAAFFFPAGTSWTSLTEVGLSDRHGKLAGNIDVVLVAYDDSGRVTDFGALEVQAVYISGNIRRAFATYIANPAGQVNMDWSKQQNYPRPDYVSSSRKRLAPQLIYKGGILHAWHKRQAVAVDSSFFATLPVMTEVSAAEAEIAWLIYDLRRNPAGNRYQLVRNRVVYTRFDSALDTLTKTEPADVQGFLGKLQERLDEKLEAADEQGSAADAPSLGDIVES